MGCTASPAAITLPLHALVVKIFHGHRNLRTVIFRLSLTVRFTASVICEGKWCNKDLVNSWIREGSWAISE
ncbi:hypothetical protein SUGI_1178140 [Cryptomeria japonica]|nr:hypothetical protein SUGI_1178140 [Cryptomeria japonica]